MKFSDIPQLIGNGSYAVDIDWAFIESVLQRYAENCNLDLDPDFQRGHVWTKDKQIAYVEYKLRGGTGSNLILFNCPNWSRGGSGPLVLVDGKQRLEAVRKFLRNELPILGGFYFKDFEGKLPFFGTCSFRFCINDLPNRASVLTWYLQLNSGGVVHTEEELGKVTKLLQQELSKY